MSASAPVDHVDPAVVRARHAEDVVVGDQIVRHRLSSRAIHWCVALTFFLSLLTGLPIWTPIFTWMSFLFGSLEVCRILHPYFGVAFTVAMAAMFVHWLKPMRMTREERSWIGVSLSRRIAEHHDEIGKYNAGQKLAFFLWTIGAVGFLLSGIPLWFPEWFALWVRAAAVLLHDVTFIFYASSIVIHIYLGTVAEPGTFRSMTEGMVSRAWARLHHPRWYREVTGEKPEK